MGNRASIILVCALLAAAPALAGAAVAPEQALVDAIVAGPPHAPLPDGIARAEAQALFAAGAAPFFDALASLVGAQGGRLLATWTIAPAARVLVPAEALPLLAALPEVRAVAADRQDGVQLVEDAPAEDGPGLTNTEGRRMIQAEEAWALGFRGEGTRIAIIGTGIDATHEAFRHADGSSRVVGWKDLISGATTPSDEHGHSTSVAASAAGSSWYDDPVHGRFQEAGVAPAADILAVRFLDASGSGSFANAIASLDWAFHNGADVTVNGWGASCSSSSIPVLQAVRATTDAGMVNVFIAGAGGPTGGTVSAPGCSDAAITVGGISSALAIYPPSGRGPCSDIEVGGAPRTCPDLVAKAVNVRSAVPRGACTFCDASGYRTFNSISSAAAFVGGAVSLIEQMKRAHDGVGWNTTARAEEQVLKLTALDLGDPGPDHTYGWGLPQVMGVHALLVNSSDAIIVPTLVAPAPTLHEGDAGTMSLRVRNMGAAIATGELSLTLQRPDGVVETVGSKQVALGLLDAAEVAGTFVANGARPAGEYVLRGTFDHTWTNETTGEIVHDVIVREAVFEVKRVTLVVEAHGLEAHALPLVPQHVTVTVRNVGNEDAHAVVVRFTAPDHYVFAHREGLDAAQPMSRYAAPPPDEVREDPNFGRLTLTFLVGDLAAGAEWSFDTTLHGTQPGEHRFLLTVSYCDGAGRCPSTQGMLLRQTVNVP